MKKRQPGYKLFVLPENTTDKITLNYKNGILKIKIPKLEEIKSEAKVIDVK